MRSSRKNAEMNNSKLYVGGEYDGMVQNLGSFYFLWFLNIFLSLIFFILFLTLLVGAERSKPLSKICTTFCRSCRSSSSSGAGRYRIATLHRKEDSLERRRPQG